MVPEVTGTPLDEADLIAAVAKVKATSKVQEL
jgi:hypothetical protein